VTSLDLPTVYVSPWGSEYKDGPSEPRKIGYSRNI
jgi:hypothetical protein